MRHEENDDIITVTVEATDDRLSVMDWLNGLERESADPKPVIVVLLADAVLRRPGDLRELKQITASQDRHLVLVLEDNERLRQWARRQGYSVFATLESGLKALSQQRIVHATKPLYEYGDTESEALLCMGKGPVFEGSLGGNTHCLVAQQGTKGETYPAPVAVEYSRIASGQVKVPGAIIEHYSSRITELTVGKHAGIAAQQRTRSYGATAVMDLEPMDLAFIAGGEQAVLDIPLPQPSISEETMFSPYEEEDLPQEQFMAVEPLPIISWPRTAQRGWQDKLMLLLVVLLVLGILGGVGFGYLLSIAHTVSEAISPASDLYRLVWGM